MNEKDFERLAVRILDELAGIKADIAELKENIAEVKEDIAEVKEDAHITRAAVNSLIE